MVTKKIYIVLVILALIICGLIVYLDRVILQKDLKAYIIEGIEKSTGKKAVIRSINFNIFKGLVIRDLIISENNIAIINSKEVSCSFLILPLLKKQIIIPSIKFRSPEIFAERRPDNSINLVELFTKNKLSRTGFNFLVRKICVRGANINFHDSALTPPFIKKIVNLNADVYLALPAKVRFNFEFALPDDPSFKIKSSGEYDIPKSEFRSDVNIKDLAPGQLSRYYEKLDFSIAEGRCDAAINLTFKDKIINANLNGQTKGLVFSKDKITAKIDSDIKTGVKYALTDQQFTYSGDVNARDLTLVGLEAIDKVNRLKGKFTFDNSGISSGDISAEILGLPVTGRFMLTDFSNPAIKIEVGTDLSLTALQDILKDTFKITIPADLVGRGKLYVVIEDTFPQTASPHVGGFLEVSGAKIAINNNKSAFEGVNGKFNFTNNQLTWSDLELKYLGTPYKTSGMLTDFNSPGVQMKLSSENLEMESVFGINDKLITFSKLTGTYYNSKFSLEGDLDLTDKESTSVNLSGMADVDLNDLKVPLKKFKDKLDKIKPSGIIHTEFTLNGNVNDLKSCDIEAKLSCPSLSLYDLKSSGVFLNYRQKSGIADIPFLRALFYGGAIDATAKIDLIPKDMPYTISADVKGAKIEQWKLDTAFKDQDIAGAIYAKAKVTGYSDDTSRLTASGKITISNGKLWQLNLFKGLGVLLFTSDFSNIIFSEGTCNFTVRDKAFFADDMMLKSDLLNLYGPTKIDFLESVKTIKADLKVELQEDALASGARKNITTAIGKYSLITITGTLKELKYALKPDVGGIIEDIADRIFTQ